MSDKIKSTQRLHLQLLHELLSASVHVGLQICDMHLYHSEHLSGKELKALRRTVAFYMEYAKVHPCTCGECEGRILSVDEC